MLVVSRDNESRAIAAAHRHDLSLPIGKAFGISISELALSDVQLEQSKR